MNSPVSRLNDLPILTPSEIEEQAIAILEELQNSPIPPVDKSQLIQKLQDFKEQWHYAFTDFGTDYQGELAYRDLITDFDQTIAPLANKWLPPSGTGNRAVNVIISMLSTPKSVAVPLTKRLSIARSKLKAKLEEDKNQNFPIPEFAKPIFIVSAPRAGSTLLFETLAQFPDLWTIGDESHKIIEGIPALHPAARNFSSNRLIESDATPEIALNLRKRFVTQLQNREGVRDRT
ncbi:MAG: sulfotransferase [Dolichospermum sp.]